MSAVAKALRDFARANPNLVVKGGMVGDGVLSAADINVLADLPSRDTLLAQFAGALPRRCSSWPGWSQALPRNLAYGLSALDRPAPGRRRGAGRAEPAEPPRPAEAPAAEAAAEAADGRGRAAEAPQPTPAEPPRPPRPSRRRPGRRAPRPRPTSPAE